MSNQYPPPSNDPYAASRTNSQYFSEGQPTEFSPFFTSDYLPLSTPPTPSTTLPPTFNTAGQAYPFGTAALTNTGTGNISADSYNDIEEEKRRRNTAASARFRVKKKEREQVLEKTANEVRDRVRGLESRVQMLERENGWLRGLVGEKRRNLGLSGSGGRKKDEDEEDRQEERREERREGKKKGGKRREIEYKEEREERSTRSPRKRNDGVGTGR